jgi:L-aminopeptidase/D-esterase-like protein
MSPNNSITDVSGIQVGHAHDKEALTGCTVILCQDGAVAGADQRGGAPGTRETDLLRPTHLVEMVHAIALAGGSAYGLAAASGVMRFLEESGAGFDTSVACVPIVPAAVLYDLEVGRADIRPDEEMGYRACQNASERRPAEGNVGAGCGASVGKVLGMQRAMKAGVGTASIQIAPHTFVGALVAVNVFGDIVDPDTGDILAGARSGDAFADTLEAMKGMVDASSMGFARRESTMIGVVATNAQLSKEQTNKIAQMAQCGVARTVRPAHTMLDGDILFALSTGTQPADVNIVGAFAAEAVAEAVLRGVRAARPIGNLPAAAPRARSSTPPWVFA